jgi:hypothetical protein
LAVDDVAQVSDAAHNKPNVAGIAAAVIEKIHSHHHQKYHPIFEAAVANGVAHW